MRALAGEIQVVFLPNYDMRLARVMVAGLDVWLNMPQPPLDVSGTSGMKSALNGVPDLSFLDGWWLEQHIEGSPAGLLAMAIRSRLRRPR